MRIASPLTPLCRRETLVDKLLPSIVTVGIIVLAFVGMYFGWRALARRSSGLPAPDVVPADSGPSTYAGNGLYVATTLADQPLQRVTAHELGFRSRCTLTVGAGGVSIALTGRDPFFIARESIRGLDRATWAIDKAVEPGGLVAIAWQLGEQWLDSYFRMDGGSEDLLEAGQAIVGDDE